MSAADVTPVRCQECGGSDLEWTISHATNSSAPDGRLRMNEIRTVATLGCNECSATIKVLDEDALRAQLAAAPVAVEVPERVEKFVRENRFLVLKRADLERWATPAQRRELERTCEMIRAGRLSEGKRIDSYVVVADDWPEYEETWAKIEARVTGQPITPSRLLNDGKADRFDLGFVEACAILAAKPFDQPTLAAGIIKEGGYQDDLAGTISDYPGIEILRRELGIDALRSNGGATTGKEDAHA